MPKRWVIIPAAGSGQRMRSSVPKQYLRLKGQTILEHTLDIFLRRDDIAGVVVCTAVNDTVWPTLSASSHRLVMNTEGGDTRAQSVVNGLAMLSEYVKKDDWVLVHDAARPCLNEVVLKTLNRALIWQAQTPQMFRYQLLKEALSNALTHSIVVTDESSAIEAVGYQPRLIEGESANFKITTPEDLAMAEFLLEQQQTK